MPNKRLAQCCVLLATTQLLVTVGILYLKFTFNNTKEPIEPVVFALVREVFAGIILFILTYFFKELEFPNKDKTIFYLSGLALSINQVCYVYGVKYTGVIVAATLQAAIPVLTTTLSIILKFEDFHWYKVYGIIMSVAGTIVMVLGGGDNKGNDKSDSSTKLIGNILILTNVTCISMYIVIVKYLIKKYSSLTVTSYSYIIAACHMAIFGVFIAHKPSQWHFPAQAIGPLLWWVIIGSVLTFWVMSWTSKYVNPSVVSGFNCIQPIFGSILAIIFLHEQLKWFDLGGIFIVLGLSLVTYQEHIEEKKSKSQYQDIQRRESECQLFSKENTSSEQVQDQPSPELLSQ